MRGGTYIGGNVELLWSATWMIDGVNKNDLESLRCAHVRAIKWAGYTDCIWIYGIEFSRFHERRPRKIQSRCRMSNVCIGKPMCASDKLNWNQPLYSVTVIYDLVHFVYFYFYLFIRILFIFFIFYILVCTWGVGTMKWCVLSKELFVFIALVNNGDR